MEMFPTSWKIELAMKRGINVHHYKEPIGSMYGIYVNVWGILMVNMTIYGIHTEMSKKSDRP